MPTLHAGSVPKLEFLGVVSLNLMAYYMPLNLKISHNFKSMQLNVILATHATTTEDGSD